MELFSIRIQRTFQLVSTPFEMYLSGFKYREIAERTGVSLGTIKSRIFHCRKKLKAILAE